MKAIIFARVSSKDQEEGQSIPSQVRRLTEYALRKGLQIDQTVQITESSTKERRKQFDQILAYVKKSKEPIALVTDTVDRLQRSFRETPLLDELRKQGKLELHFLRENLVVDQESNSSQLLQWDIGVLFASSYVRQMGDNVKRSQEQCLRNGQWISKAPFGYKNVSLPSGERSIEVDEYQAAYVVKIFELYAQGNNSFQTVAEKMQAEGLRSSRGRKVSARTIELILKNPFYHGVMIVRGKVYQHKYPPLISEWLFDKVQSIMANHHKVPIQYAGKPMLLRGLIQCKQCGCTVTGDTKKQKYTYYSCNNSKRICTKKWIKEETLVEQLLTHFDTIQLTDEQVSEIVEYLQTWEDKEQEFQKKTLVTLQENQNQIQERISKLIDMHVDGKIDADSYHFKLAEYKRTQQHILSDVEAYSSTNQAELIAAQDVLNLMRDAKDIFLSSKLDEKQQLLNCFFSNLQLNNEKLDVELRKPFNMLTKTADHPIWRD